MLSIGKLGEGGARYYTEGLGAVDEYYTESGARSGLWMGAGAGLLGLEGDVDTGALSDVLAGRDPTDGVRLGGTRSSGGVAGFDLCFRAPKSVSLLEALGHRDTAEGVRAAHRAAVAAALEYMDRSATLVRRGHAGERVLAGAGLVGAGFEHVTSRAGDPHLHTHVVVANLARGGDGRWSALDGRALYRHAKTGGFLYEAVLRHELTRTLGLRWGPVVNGIADVSGVSKELIEAFSRRRAQIVAELSAQGASSARAAQVAALTTRPAKDPSAGLDTLRVQWRARAADLGVDDGLWAGLVGPRREPAALSAESAADRLLGPDGLTASRSSFDRRELLQAVAALAGEGAELSGIETVAEAVLADDRAIRVGSDRLGPRWSTLELVATEQTLIAEGLSRRAGGFGVVDQRLVATALGFHETLSGEQAAMVHTLTRSGDGVQVVIGVAGSGKTYALGAARQAWHAAGYQVIGTALSARAAQELADGAHIPTSTVARLLIDLGDGRRPGLAKESVLVVDEAAMVSTRDLAALAGHARRAGAKLVLVGDDRQLPSIAAGGAFTALADRLGAVELVENRRQRDGWERHALAQLRGGHADTALAAYHAHGRRHHHERAERIHERLVGDWAAARSDGTQVMMLATRRADVDRLNDLARQQLRQAGQLGPDLVEHAGRCFAAGDQVICGRNDTRLGVINGTRATVVDLALDGLRLRTAGGRDLVVPDGYLDDGHLRHGYATTVHKAQGATTKRTFILADEHLYQEAGYVALSRGRDRNDLYTAVPDTADHEGDGPGRPDRRDHLVRGLSRSRAQQAAIDSVDLAGRRLDDLESERQQLEHETDGGYRANRQRARRVESLMNERVQALGLWAADHPRPEHLDLLGNPPRQPQRRAEWIRAAGELSAFRERHGHTYHPEQVPEHGRARADHDYLTRTLREATRVLDRSRSLHLERDHDLGLGL